MNITDNLRCTDAQRHAILHDRGPAMVIAGPGSGKTFVITHRISHLINDLGVSPDKILVITFTKAAAKEMQQRAALLLQGKSQPHFGTFHSVFYNILRQSGMGGLSILSEKDRRRIFLHLMEKFEIQTPDPVEFIQRLSGDISCFKVRHALDKEFMPGAVDAEIFPEIIRTYECELKLMGKMDFDDMIIKTHRLLVRRSDLKKRWSARFEYIMIDEFQDIDPLQFACVKLLLGAEKNLFAVGDDDQSIYSFRGAQPSIMLGFEEEFESCEKIILNSNFRSEKNIIRHSLTLIGNNKDRFKKSVFGVKEGSGEVSAKLFENVAEEALFISGYRRTHEGSMAVLSRTQKRADAIVHILSKEGHRVITNDRKGSLFDHFAVNDIMAYLQLAAGDMSRKNFLMIMNKPYRYISREDITKGEVIDSQVLLTESKGKLSHPYIEKLFKDLEVLEHMRPFAAITYILRVMGYEEYLDEYIKERDMDPQSVDRVKEELLNLAAGYETIEEFLERGRTKAQGRVHDHERDISGSHEGDFGAKNGGCDNEKAEREQDAIRVMTMHASKGLEFDTVFITDAIGGNIPHKGAVSEDDIQEERRLMYVAMTRAKKTLFICTLRRDGYKKAVPSVFISQAGFNSFKKQ